MEKTFTAVNISEWFTSEASFANIKLEEAEEPQADKAETPETRWEKCRVAAMAARRLMLTGLSLASCPEMNHTGISWFIIGTKHQIYFKQD